MAEIDRSQLATELRGLGLRAGQAVMLHSSLRALGSVRGGAPAVVDSILEILGPAGTILVPAFRDSVWGGPEHFGNRDCSPCPQQLCPSRRPGFQGVIAEEVRQRLGSLRSCHPTHSWAALGGAAELLLAGHHQSPTPCGAGSPFERLVASEGCILTLGVGVDRVTYWHYYEERLQVPYMGHYWPKERHLNHCVGALRLQYEFPGILQDMCRASGILKTGPVGKSVSGLMIAREFESFLATAFADDPWCLALRPPSRDSSDLALDALGKAAAMLRAWERGPRRPKDVCHFPPAAIVPPSTNDMVRRDCPAFAGLHEDAQQRMVPLCRANGRHPDYFRSGGVFNQWGPTTCARCSWHQKFPVMAT